MNIFRIGVCKSNYPYICMWKNTFRIFAVKLYLLGRLSHMITDLLAGGRQAVYPQNLLVFHRHLSMTFILRANTYTDRDRQSDERENVRLPVPIC